MQWFFFGVSYIINIEMQVLRRSFWNDRSLLYLCSTFNNLEKGEGYTEVKPAYHIGILDFTRIDYWAKLFKAKTWEDLKTLYV